jgi:hypothetical protein
MQYPLDPVNGGFIQTFSEHSYSLLLSFLLPRERINVSKIELIKRKRKEKGGMKRFKGLLFPFPNERRA